MCSCNPRSQAAGKAGEDIRPVGSDIKRGQVVLQAGDMLDAPEIGILATVGAAEVQVMLLDSVSIAQDMLMCREDLSRVLWCYI